MRLFIAMPLPDVTKTELSRVIEKFKTSGAKVKWVDAKNIHMTLKFLGETDEKLVPKISESIKKVAREFDPVTAVMDKLGGFPNLNKARVYWAGFGDSPEVLAKIAKKVDLEMRQLRFEKEKRPFKSHLTIGRVKDSRALGDLPGVIESYEFKPQTIVFDEIILYKSTLTPRGPIYDKLFTAKLKKEETFS